MLVFDDAKGNYNWISLTTELLRRYKIEVNDPNFIIKKKIKGALSCFWLVILTMGLKALFLGYFFSSSVHMPA